MKLDEAATRQDVIEQLEDRDEDGLREAYGQTFDLVDSDNSGRLQNVNKVCLRFKLVSIGTLDEKEVTDWLNMCGAELNLNKITGVLLGEGDINRDKFTKLMSSSAASNRRAYDISGNFKGHD